MNWEAVGAVGELLGGVAVLVTLIYLALQVRKSQVALEVNTLEQAQMIQVEMTRLLVENSEIFAKANSGIELNDSEDLTFRHIMYNRNYQAFVSYSRAKKLGSDVNILINNFAFFLHVNPGAKRFWLDLTSSRGIREAAKDWHRQVVARLNELEGGA